MARSEPEHIGFELYIRPPRPSLYFKMFHEMAKT